ncbi:MAG: DUF4276 family protein [Sedimentisphaerales bacterium]|nr:DUF4276 family protein [Sedimentisphaerales bacterium]
MDELHYTLLSDGPSDKALMPILTWLLQQHVPNLPIQSRWADLRMLPKPPRELCTKIQESVHLFPCNLLFIHRDAEKASLDDRLNEIRQAVSEACIDTEISDFICVVPIRMTEAWLLFDVDAIRQAAGNPNGTLPLQIPRLSDVESLPNPKKILHKALRTATEYGTHRRKRFEVKKAVQRVPKCIEDFSPLRTLSAFTALEEEVLRIVESQNWNN